MDGAYTTKSAYGGQQRSQGFWRALWSAEALPRCKEIAWRVVKRMLPVRSALRVRGVQVKEDGPFCNSSLESITHVLFLCPIVSRWWFSAPMGVRFQPSDDPAELIQQILNKQDDQLSGLCFTFIYMIWELRNGVIHQQQQFNVEGLLARFQRLCVHEDSRTDVLPPLAIGHRSNAGWKRPRGDVIKINFDASWVLNLGAGFGFIARNDNDLIMAAAMTHPV